MGNMSYCRFENTLSDLEDCKEVLDKGELTSVNEYDDLLSDSEFDNAIELIEKCREIVAEFEDTDLDEARETYNRKVKKKENES